MIFVNNLNLYGHMMFWNQLEISCRLSEDKNLFKSKAKPTVVAVFAAKQNRYTVKPRVQA